MPQGNRNRGSASSAAAPVSKAKGAAAPVSKGKGKRATHVQNPRGTVHMEMAMKEEEEAPPPPPPPGYSDEQYDEAPPPPPQPGYSHPAPRNAWWKDIVQRGAQQASNEDYAHQEQSAQAAHPCACTCGSHIRGGGKNRAAYSW